MKKLLLFGVCSGIFLWGVAGALFTKEEFQFAQDMGILSEWLEFSTASQTRTKETVARREAPQILMNFASYLGISLPSSDDACSFSDIGTRSVSSAVAQQIKTACRMGIFKGTYGRFYPNAYFTNSEAITAVIRVLDGVQKESTAVHWSEPYYRLAKQRGLLQNSVLLGKFAPITRWNLLSLLLLTSEEYDATATSSTSKTPCPADIEALKQTARIVYTWAQLADALATLDKKCVTK